MKIIEKISKKQESIRHNKLPTIAFMGDSVTHGCFDVYVKNNKLETFIDMKNAYHEKIREIFSMLYTETPLVIINAGISGDRADLGVDRLQRDVLDYNPDLVVVCYGLNDASRGEKLLDKYEKSLESIFEQIIKSGAEVIFMTPNLRTDKCDQPTGCQIIDDTAELVAKNENEGWLEIYLNRARVLCDRLGVPVCDCNMLWQKLKENNVEINSLLSNRINHPTEKMHWLFAYELVRTMFLN